MGRAATVVVGAVACLGLVSIITAYAAAPPFPSEFRLYGAVTLLAANLEPPEQPVFALVNGRVCGTGTVRLNPPNAEADPGKTVYVVDVAADGSSPNEVPGCARPGSPVRLYFPAGGLLSGETVAFVRSGSQRLDFAFDAADVAQRVRAVMVANDGVQ